MPNAKVTKFTHIGGLELLASTSLSGDKMVVYTTSSVPKYVPRVNVDDKKLRPFKYANILLNSCVRVRVCVYMFVCVCVCVCMCLCLYVCVCVRIHPHIYTSIYIRADAYLQVLSSNNGVVSTGPLAPSMYMRRTT